MPFLEKRLNFYVFFFVSSRKTETISRKEGKEPVFCEIGNKSAKGIRVCDGCFFPVELDS